MPIPQVLRLYTEPPCRQPSFDGFLPLPRLLQPSILKHRLQTTNQQLDGFPRLRAHCPGTQEQKTVGTTSPPCPPRNIASFVIPHWRRQTLLHSSSSVQLGVPAAKGTCKYNYTYMYLHGKGGQPHAERDQALMTLHALPALNQPHSEPTGWSSPQL